jgi:hypothetical protein
MFRKSKPFKDRFLSLSFFWRPENMKRERARDRNVFLKRERKNPNEKEKEKKK